MIALLARSFATDAPPPRTHIGFGCDAGEKAAEITAKLEKYMRFLNDASLTGRPGYPDSRASWPDANGNPTDAWNSPLAHRKFFEWQANGASCIDQGAIRNLLFAIGVDETLCGQDVAEALAHSMDKGGDDGCVTWPEYLNSRFSLGPVSDGRLPDPTVAQIAKESGAAPPDSGGSGGSGVFFKPLLPVTAPAGITFKTLTLPDGSVVLEKPLKPLLPTGLSPVVVAGGIGLGVLLLMFLL